MSGSCLMDGPSVGPPSTRTKGPSECIPRTFFFLERRMENGKPPLPPNEHGSTSTGTPRLVCIFLGERWGPDRAAKVPNGDRPLCSGFRPHGDFSQPALQMLSLPPASRRRTLGPPFEPPAWGLCEVGRAGAGRGLLPGGYGGSQQREARGVCVLGWHFELIGEEVRRGCWRAGAGRGVTGDESSREPGAETQPTVSSAL